MAEARSVWGLPLRGVRFRTTAAGVLVVGLALLVGAVALVVALRITLTNEVRSAVMLRAEGIAAVVETGGVVPARLIGDGEVHLFQVADLNGAVVVSSPNLTGSPLLQDLAPGQTTTGTAPFEEGGFVFAAVGTPSSAGDRVVIAAQSLESVDETMGAVVGILLIGMPLLLVVMAWVTWRVVGRALSPVDRIRDEVEAISSSELHRRVPVPEGDDEISRLARTMNAMLGRLETAQQRQRRFVSDVSHELRSPVAAIRQHAEVTLAHPESSSATELAETVRDENLRVQELVEDMLLLARADERVLLESPTVLDLDDIVLEEAARLREITHLEIDTTSVSAGRITGDVKSLQRVLRNLADNAARHARSRIAFGLQESEGSVLLRVDDDGPGIPPQSRQVVFERFVRLDVARDRDTGGSGLGLAIVAEVVDLHDGEVGVFASPDGGARFEIRLPARVED